MNKEKHNSIKDEMYGKCTRLEYLEKGCHRIPQDKKVIARTNDVIPLDLICVGCMINSAHQDLAVKLSGIEQKLGIVK